VFSAGTYIVQYQNPILADRYPADLSQAFLPLVHDVRDRDFSTGCDIRLFCKNAAIFIAVRVSAIFKH